MVEPRESLQGVFDKAIDTAKKLNHDYVTIEHLLFSMLCDETFANVVSGSGADPEFIKKNVENYLKVKCDDIIRTDKSKKFKPKKTQAVERVLNRAFTQVLSQW